MSDKLHGGDSQAVATWIKETLDEAVDELMRRGVVSAELVEARPLWSLPYKIMIGQIRDANEKTTFLWLISGEVPVDFVSSATVSTPREAARHFALKWQLDASRYQNPSVQEELGPDQQQGWDLLGETLARQAEALYAMSENESLWQELGNS